MAVKPGIREKCGEGRGRRDSVMVLGELVASGLRRGSENLYTRVSVVEMVGRPNVTSWVDGVEAQ